jgi:hypothetical protein
VRPAPESGAQDRERPLRLDDRDRRRLLLASALTVVALPAVWLANRDDTTSPRPNVAAVGAPVADGEAASVPPASVDPMGTVDAQYLDGAVPAPPQTAGPVTPAIGTADGRVVATATAIFRRSVTSSTTCLFNGVKVGSHITVVNVDNDRSMTCTTALRPMDQPQDELMMSADAFATIADPSEAPIVVEIRE